MNPQPAFTCSICGEVANTICTRCTKDTCENHLCRKCHRCSDCCECDVPLDNPADKAQEAKTEAPV